MNLPVHWVQEGSLELARVPSRGLGASRGGGAEAVTVPPKDGIFLRALVYVNNSNRNKSTCQHHSVGPVSPTLSLAKLPSRNPRPHRSLPPGTPTKAQVGPRQPTSRKALHSVGLRGKASARKCCLRAPVWGPQVGKEIHRERKPRLEEGPRGGTAGARPELLSCPPPTASPCLGGGGEADAGLCCRPLLAQCHFPIGKGESDIAPPSQTRGRVTWSWTRTSMLIQETRTPPPCY